MTSHHWLHLDLQPLMPSVGADLPTLGAPLLNHLPDFRKTLLQVILLGPEPGLGLRNSGRPLFRGLVPLCCWGHCCLRHLTEHILIDLHRCLLCRRQLGICGYCCLTWRCSFKWRVVSVALVLALCTHASADVRRHLDVDECPVPKLPSKVQLRERFWSILKTIDVFYGDTLLGYVYTSALTLDGRAKWVSAEDGKVLASSVAQIQSAPTMVVMPQFAPELEIEDCKGSPIARVSFALDVLLTVRTPQGAIAATSSAGGKDGASVTIRDSTRYERARIERLAGWMDGWDLTIMEGGVMHEEHGKKLKVAVAEMRVLRKKAEFLERKGKRIEAAAAEIEVQALRQRISELEKQERRRETKLGAAVLANDPRVLVLAIAAESPAISFGRGIQLAKAPVFVFALLLVIGWGLCCCYLGKHFYLQSSRYSQGYEELGGAKMKEDGPGRDRLDALFSLRSAL